MVYSEDSEAVLDVLFSSSKTHCCFKNQVTVESFILINNGIAYVICLINNGIKSSCWFSCVCCLRIPLIFKYTLNNFVDSDVGHSKTFQNKLSILTSIS